MASCTKENVKLVTNAEEQNTGDNFRKMMPCHGYYNEKTTICDGKGACCLGTVTVGILTWDSTKTVIALGQRAVFDFFYQHPEILDSGIPQEILDDLKQEKGVVQLLKETDTEMAILVGNSKNEQRVVHLEKGK